MSLRKSSSVSFPISAAFDSKNDERQFEIQRVNVDLPQGIITKKMVRRFDEATRNKLRVPKCVMTWAATRIAKAQNAWNFAKLISFERSVFNSPILGSTRAAVASRSLLPMHVLRLSCRAST